MLDRLHIIGQRGRSMARITDLSPRPPIASACTSKKTHFEWTLYRVHSLTVTKTSPSRSALVIVDYV